MLVKTYEEHPAPRVTAIEWGPETMNQYSTGFEPEFTFSDEGRWCLVEKTWSDYHDMVMSHTVPLEPGYFIVKRSDGYYEAFVPAAFRQLYKEVTDVEIHQK